jgi:hypothetical protein
MLPLALAELRLIDEYEFGVQQGGRPRADTVRGTIKACRLEAREAAGIQLGAVATRYEPRT